jgi:hypothetical protein
MSVTLRVRPSDRQSPQVRPPIRVLPVPRAEPPTDQERADADLDATPAKHATPAEDATPTRPLPALIAPPTGYGQAHPTDLDDQPARADQPPTTATDAGIAAAGCAESTPATRTGAAPADRARVAAGTTGESSEGANVPAAKAAVHRFVAVCLEVIGGYRPPTHLRPLCAPGELAEVVRQLTGRATTLGAGTAPAPATALGGRGRSGPGAGGSRTPVMTRAATGAPARSPRLAPVAPHDRTAIRRVLITEPVPGVAEVVVLLDRRQRTLAMTLRMELRAARWACTHLRVL